MKVADLIREADGKFKALPLELDDGTVVNLRNLVRLDETARKTAQVLISALDDKKDHGADDDALARQERTLRDLFLLVADDTAAMKGLVETWDLAVMLTVLERWMEDTQAGEASSSAN